MRGREKKKHTLASNQRSAKTGEGDIDETREELVLLGHQGVFVREAAFVVFVRVESRGVSVVVVAIGMAAGSLIVLALFFFLKTKN